MELWAGFGIVVVALFGLVLAVAWLQRARYRRKYPLQPAPEGYTVTLTERGRTGYADYRDETGSVRFDWEFGGTVVVIVMVPTPEQWAAKVPWAAHRRAQILERVASEIQRQKCRSCTWTIEDSWIHMHERKGI